MQPGDYSEDADKPRGNVSVCDFGNPPAPVATLSAPCGPIMADPAWIFDHASNGSEKSGGAPRMSLLKRLAQIAVQAPTQQDGRDPNARQAAQEGPGDSSDPKEQDR